MAGWRTERKDRGGTCPEVDGDIDAKKKHSFLGFNWQLLLEKCWYIPSLKLIADRP